MSERAVMPQTQPYVTWGVDKPNSYGCDRPLYCNGELVGRFGTHDEDSSVGSIHCVMKKLARVGAIQYDPPKEYE